MKASRRTSCGAAAISALLLAGALAGCSTAAGTNSRPSAGSGTSAGASEPAVGGTPATATPAAPASMVPGGSAAENKAYFDQVSTTLFASAATANGRTIIDTLTAAGFDKASMQVTPDRTSTGGAVDSILFSVKLGGKCLLGQRGPDGFSSSVQPALGDGSCLVGKTRPINW